MLQRLLVTFSQEPTIILNFEALCLLLVIIIFKIKVLILLFWSLILFVRETQIPFFSLDRFLFAFFLQFVRCE